MKVLLAGDRGYIGSVLAPHLERAGHIVGGLDLGLYDGCDFGRCSEVGSSEVVDIRGVAAGDLGGYDAVVCLAALSDEPLGDFRAAATHSINVDGTIALASAAKAAGVPRFVFASSCSLYGAAGSHAVAEDAQMRATTAYGESKVIAEQRLAAMADDGFSPTYMRNASAYGVSPRLRLDVLVNNLAGAAVTSGLLRPRGDGSPWRPLVHVEDVARATLAILEAPRELVHNEAFNIGGAEGNLQIRDIAELVASTAAGSIVIFSPGTGPDKTSYRVDFSKLRTTFPALDLQWTVAAGVRELIDAYEANRLTLGDFESSRYVRLRRVQQLVDEHEIDASLRRIVRQPPTMLRSLTGAVRP